MSEIKQGERVRCWPGSVHGRSYLAEVISDGIVEFGKTRCYRVRKDDGGSDYIADTHVKSLADYTLGQRVKFSEHMKRRYVDTYNQPYPKGPNKVWSGEAYPGKRLDGGEGIIIGKRTLSDGTYHYGNSDEPGEYDAHRHFPAYLIATSLHSAPVHVLPEHITALEEG